MNPCHFAIKVTAVAVLTMFSVASSGHSEHDKPRYVSPSGKDAGFCESPLAPCQTFNYALSRANKGDKIIVGEGHYKLDNAAALFSLISDVVPVKAGFSAKDGFEIQNTAANPTYLSGVPVKYAETLRKRGFVVNTDQKSLTAEEKAELEQKLAGFEKLSQAQSNVACVDGEADGFTCNNIDLLAHVPLGDFGEAGSGGNDIWGHVDLNTGREYAIIGLRSGIGVVDVTEPTSPEVVGTVVGDPTLWRDIKVHQFYDETALRWKAYAYVTAENIGAGLIIIDLNNLLNGISVADVDRTDVTAHNVFISNVDYSTGVALSGKGAVLHLLGANSNGGAFNSFEMKSDAVGGVSSVFRPNSSNGYTHDASAMVITDERINSQCTPEGGACEIFFDYNEEEVKIWDKTRNQQPQMISQFDYDNANYVHSGWTTEDGMFLFVHDELDERNAGLNSTLRVFDISDLNNPQQVGTWTGPSKAIDHNGYVRGNRYYFSNYERGLTVLDITDPANPVEVGMFDTFPVSDFSTFKGAWGVYPFLPSGNILISDVNSGLYVFADKTVGQSEHDSLRFDAKNYNIDEGGNVVINVERVGMPNEAVTVRYETHIGSALEGDFDMISGTLSWEAGDSQSKTITLNAKVDSEDEFKELFFVRLFSPTGGASLISPSMSMVYINGAEVPALAAFATNEIEVKETDGQVTIDVIRSGNVFTDLTVDYQVVGGDADSGTDYELAAGSISWAVGDSANKSINLNLLNDNDTESTEQIQLRLTQPTQGSPIEEITVSVRDDESNQPPELDVSQDQTVNAGEVVSLSATGSDPEGYALAYKWTQTSGSAVTVSNDSASMINFSAPAQAGTLVFEVTVTDDFNATSSKSITVTVEGQTQPTTPTPTTSSGGGGGSSGLLLLSMLGLIGLRRQTNKKIS